MLFPGDPDLPISDADIALLWADAERIITKRDRIVFIGYSLPEYDSYAAQFFRKAAKNRKVVAINPSSDHLERFRNLFGNDVELRQDDFRGCPFGRRGPVS